MPLGNLWPRWREVKADTYALQTTRNPQAFISAMTRLANQNLADADPPVWNENQYQKKLGADSLNRGEIWGHK